MFLYLSVIFISMIIISALNILFGMEFFGYSIGFVIMAVIASTIFQFVIDGIIAFIWKKMPNKWFGVDAKISMVGDKEIAFYNKIKVKDWKESVWELGGMGGFSKKSIINPSDPEYIKLFIIESNKGVVEHFVSCFGGFLCIFLFPLKYALVIGVPVAIVNTILNILPIFVLRYNIPKLKVILKRATRNKEREMRETEKI